MIVFALYFAVMYFIMGMALYREKYYHEYNKRTKFWKCLVVGFLPFFSETIHGWIYK